MLKHELVFPPFEPLGLQYLKSILLKNGYEIEIYDCLASHPSKIKYLKEKGLFRCGSDDNDICKKIKKFNPDIIGISGMFFSQYESFYHVADLARETAKNVVIIGGGAFPSSYKEKILAENKNIDFVVIGEGEITIMELLENLDSPEKVKGICFRKKETNEVICTEPRQPILNLDTIDFPWRNFSEIWQYSKPVGYNYADKFNLIKFIKSSLLYFCLSVPGLRYLFSRLFNFKHRKRIKSLFMPFGYVLTSRGCPNRCTFCAIHKVLGPMYRVRSAKNVLEEIDMLVAHGAKEIVIIDDNFTVSKSRTIEICKGIIERNYNIRLMAPAVSVPTIDREVLEYLYKAGFRELQFAIENGDQEFLTNVIRKNLNLEYAKKVIREAKDVGFYNRVLLIFGYPKETKETMLKTLAFAFEKGVDSARFYVFQPFPGTEAFEMARQMHAIDDNLDLSRLKILTDVPQVETNDFSREDVKNIYDLAYDILKKRNYAEVKNNLREILNWQ